MRSSNQKWLIAILLITISFPVFAQVKISGSSSVPHSSAMLEVESSTRGFLPPRMSSTERLAIPVPATGLLVYDSTDHDFYYFNGTVWQKIINLTLVNAGKNTLNQAYNQGGAGAGRNISAISGPVDISNQGQNTTLRISNVTDTGISVTATIGNALVSTATEGSALIAQTTDGSAVNVTSGKGAAILINKTDTGYGIRAFTEIDFSKDLVSVKSIGNHTGSYLSEDGRAGFFMIENASNTLPALQANTTGLGHGMLGITGTAPTGTTEIFPASGVAGLSFLTSGRRNGISGFSRRAKGVFGISNVANSWSIGPDSIQSGVYGLSRTGEGISGGSTDLFAGTVGYVKSGFGVLGVNGGFGHGVVGVTKGVVTTGTQAGVWGMIQDSASWSGHAASFPFVDGSYAKGRVAVLGQAGEDVALWGESRKRAGLVATVGAKSELASMPFSPTAIIGISTTLSDGGAAFLKTDSTTAPTVKIESGSDDAGLVLAQFRKGDGLRITEVGGGNGEVITMMNDTSSMNGLFIHSLNRGIGSKISLDNPMNMSTGFVVSTFGKGGAGSFSILDSFNKEPVVKAVSNGKGHAGLFSIERSASSSLDSIMPALVGRTSAGRAAFFSAGSSISPDPAVEVKTLSGSSSYFSAENDTATSSANIMAYKGKGHGLEVVSTHSTSTTPDAVLHVEGGQGFMAHFEDKTPVLGGRTDPVVLISSTAGLGTVGLKISLPLTCIGCKAAEFDGEVEMTKTLKVVGELEASKLKGEIETDKSFTVGDTLFVNGNSQLSGKLDVTGVTTLNAASTVNGNFTVNGTLHATTATASVKMFKIDHPLDEKNKYLNHISTESNEALVQYSGNAVTDNQGYSIIEMPRYVTALAKDFRYHLTIVGKGFAQAIVAEEMNAEGRFIIRTDKPYIKVSWQLTGVRQDKFMINNPLIVEEWKAQENKFER